MRISAVVLLVCLVAFQAFGQTDTPPPTTPPAGSSGLTGTGSTDQNQQNGTTEDKQKDERSAFKALVYLGEVVDTFAADELIKYLNPEDANEQKLRTIAGVDFEYRLMGKPELNHQVWVYGETIHGVRSRDVDCSKQNNARLSVCQDNLTPENLPNETDFVAILRNASSLEAFVGVRFEFPPPLQSGTDSPARLFVKGELGFLSVSGGGGDAVDNHSINFGALAVSGRFEGSFLQVGYGQNDLFLRNSNQRYLVDAYLSISPKYVPLFSSRNDDRLRPFIEFTGSFDGSTGADSIQTWFGFDYEFRDKSNGN